MISFYFEIPLQVAFLQFIGKIFGAPIWRPLKLAALCGRIVRIVQNDPAMARHAAVPAVVIVTDI